jgi:hypothetical protein
MPPELDAAIQRLDAARGALQTRARFPLALGTLYQMESSRRSWS